VGLRELLPLTRISKKFNFFFRSIAACIRENGFSHTDPSKRCFDFVGKYGGVDTHQGALTFWFDRLTQALLDIHLTPSIYHPNGWHVDWI